MTLTSVAFNKLRSNLALRSPPPELIANVDQLKQMDFSDGLEQWVDGAHPGPPTSPPPLLEKSSTEQTRLWVVRIEDVVHAREQCDFGDLLETGVIKHTNLTGGDAAFSGGELLFIDEKTIVINGCSGRYGPRNKNAMDMVEKAFVESGYGVWSMGYDEETNRPLPFIGTFPEWIS
jgi:hypothetical protein